MTRPLPISQRQARALLRAADAEGGIVEVKIGDALVRLIPAVLAQKDRAIAEDEEIRL